MVNEEKEISMGVLGVEISPEPVAETEAYDSSYLDEPLLINGARDLNILLVDDDDVAVENVMRNMKKCGVQLPMVVAEDGLDALDILRGKHPSKKIEAPYLILLDLKMPRMDGFEFLKTIRADPALASTEVFVLTTSDSNSDRAKAYHEDVAGYLLKDATTMFNWLFSTLPNYTKSSNLLQTLESNAIDEGVY